MKVGFVGLGKLGLPVAVACTHKGHDVMGFDIVPDLMSKRAQPYLETGPDGIEPFNSYLEKSSIHFGSLEEVARHSQLIFVGVQTPHEPEYEGITRLPITRADFDYTYLQTAVSELARVIQVETPVVIISTVLPGTIRRYILPRTTPKMLICYNPFFIAMGTTMRDFLHPEFVLFGVHSGTAARHAEKFYRTITDAPFYKTTVENAELIKVAYNTLISMKIAFANTLMEICHRTENADVDAVTDALKLATDRLISPRYLSGGMGDGGGCHPRDNIALSWLVRELRLSHDIFNDIMLAREDQTIWLADLMCQYSHQSGLPLAILGVSFKPETNIITGSPSLLLRNILRERGLEPRLYDPMVTGIFSDSSFTTQPHVFLIGTKHAVFKTFDFPPGSIVLDPWRYLNLTRQDLTYVPIGIGRPSA